MSLIRSEKYGVLVPEKTLLPYSNMWQIVGPVRHDINFCMGCFRPYVDDHDPTTTVLDNKSLCIYLKPNGTPTLQLFSTPKHSYSCIKMCSICSKKCAPHCRLSTLSYIIDEYVIRTAIAALPKKLLGFPMFD